MSAAGTVLEQPDLAPPGSPFCLSDRETYLRWRERKLAGYPRSAEELVVEVRDPLRLRPSERAALAALCRRANMALYAGPDGGDPRAAARAIGRAFGLERLDAHWLADDDAISSIQACDAPGSGEFIPYTDRPIHWHTDGYYNPAQRRVRSLILHCVRDAAQGGENELLDHEIAYLMLRDRDPALVRALCAADAMTIPERREAGGVARAEQTGPVFSFTPADGRLHMRFTARTRSIRWRDDDATRAAAQALERLLAGEGGEQAPVLRARLRPGMGLLCANVLHTRSGFLDDPLRPRLLLRARYYDALNCDAAGRATTEEGDDSCNTTRSSMRAALPARCPS